MWMFSQGLAISINSGTLDSFGEKEIKAFMVATGSYVIQGERAYSGVGEEHGQSD